MQTNTNCTELFIIQRMICPQLLSVKAPSYCLSCQSFYFYEDHHFMPGSVSQTDPYGAWLHLHNVFFFSLSAYLQHCRWLSSDYQAGNRNSEKLSTDLKDMYTEGITKLQPTEAGTTHLFQITTRDVFISAHTAGDDWYLIITEMI